MACTRTGARGPLPVEACGDRREILLVPAVIAEKDDVAEAVQPEAPRRRFEDLLERCLGDRDGSGKAHVRRRRIDAALRNIRDDWRHERIAERLRDSLGERPDPHVVLAQHHVRAVLLGAADRDDDASSRPARISLRSSVHVSSSTRTVEGAAASVSADAMSEMQASSRNVMSIHEHAL